MDQFIDAFVLLIALIAAFLLLPPKYDPAFWIKEGQLRRGEHPETPSCFGSGPGAQSRAENDCEYCPSAEGCRAKAPWRR